MVEFKEEFWKSDLQIKEELDEATGESRMKVIGTVQEADIINKNNRIYSREVLENAVKALDLSLRTGRVFGQVDHPLASGALKDTSHLTRKLWWDKNKLIGEMLVLNTSSGRIIGEIIRAGGRPGFSSRGHGKSSRVKIDGKGEVEKIEPGFRFDSFDFVINPSVKSAQIQKIIEGKMNSNDNRSDISEYEIEIRLQRQAGIPETSEKKTDYDPQSEVERNIRRLAGLP